METPGLRLAEVTDLPDFSGKPMRAIQMVADRIDSRDLFVGTREVTIAHGADTYRLRLTAQNRLILTKDAEKSRSA